MKQNAVGLVQAVDAQQPFQGIPGERLVLDLGYATIPSLSLGGELYPEPQYMP